MEIDQILIPFLSKVIRIVIVLIGFSIIIQEFGYNISGFVAGLGIGEIGSLPCRQRRVGQFDRRNCDHYGKAFFDWRLDQNGERGGSR